MRFYQAARMAGKSITAELTNNTHVDFHRNKMVRIIKTPSGQVRDVVKRHYKNCTFYKSERFRRHREEARRRVIESEIGFLRLMEAGNRAIKSIAGLHRTIAPIHTGGC